MNVALIGAGGNAGSRILAELLNRGHVVTAIVRRPNGFASQAAVTVREGDANRPEALAKTLTNHDAVISAVKFQESDPQALIDAVARSGVKRYLVVGGAGSLESAPGVREVDSDNFPAHVRPEALKGAAFLDVLRRRDDLDWTFLSPSRLFVPGERTGKFRLGDDRLLVDDKGVSRISFEDYAVALVDELEEPRHVRKRFTVGY